MHDRSWGVTPVSGIAVTFGDSRRAVLAVHVEHRQHIAGGEILEFCSGSKLLLGVACSVTEMHIGGMMHKLIRFRVMVRYVCLDNDFAFECS